MKMIHLLAVSLFLTVPAWAQDQVRIVVDLGNKEVTITNTLAIRERIPVLVVNIGTAQPSNMVARITSNSGTVMCYSASFTNSGTNAVGVLDLNTSELVALFSNSSPQSVKALNFGMWDVAQARLLVNTKVSLQNNPYTDGMAGPSPVGTVYLEGEWGPHTNAWQAGLVVQTGANEGEYFRRLPSELTAMVTNLMWGNLVGSITNQADLIALLDALAAGTTNEAALRALADIALQSNLTAAVTSLTALIQTNGVTNAYSMAEADAKFATGMPVYVESDPLWRAASNAYYTAAQADDRFATTNGLAILSLNHDVATNKLETVFGWGNWATNKLATTNWVISGFLGLSGGTVTGGITVGVNQSGFGSVYGTNAVISAGSGISTHDIGAIGLNGPGVSPLAAQTLTVHGSDEYMGSNLAGDLVLRGGHNTVYSGAPYGNVILSGGVVRVHGTLTILDQILVVDSQTNSVLSITATGGVQVGAASFHAETSGDIWHDPTNTAVLGILSASSIKNTNGTSVLYVGDAPTVASFSSATAALAIAQTTIATLTGQVAALLSQLPIVSNAFVAADAVITAQVASVDARLVLTSNRYAVTTAALSSTNDWLFTQVTNRDHTVTTGLQASIAANLSTFSSFTNAYAATITNVDAVAFGGTIKSGFMLASAWEDIRTNVVFGFLDTVAATNSAGAQNYLKYSHTNTWLHDGTSWRWWSRYGF